MYINLIIQKKLITFLIMSLTYFYITQNDNRLYYLIQKINITSFKFTCIIKTI